MGRYAKDSGDSFQQAPIGTHVARCYRLVDLGTQRGEYQGQPTVRNQVWITWELPNEPMDDGQPFTVSHFYTNSLNEKATLRQHLEAWRGKQFTEEELNGFDLMNILGKPCMVTVTSNEKGKSKVATVSGLPKGMTCPPQINPSSSFWMDEWDDKAFEELPQGIQDIIKRSDEYKAMKTPHGGGGYGSPEEMDSDVPF